MSIDFLITERPTEIAERDIYICESAYDEVKGQIRRLSKPGELKKVVHSSGVTEDEYYFFKRPITPQKVSEIFFLHIHDYSCTKFLLNIFFRYHLLNTLITIIIQSSISIMWVMM